MTFTDDDLKRWNGCIWREPGIVRDLSVTEFKALLARLEAAEAITKDFVEHGVLQCRPCMKRIEAWRKVKGE